MGGNYLLTAGALGLMGLLILTISNSVLNNEITVTESEVVITGISLCQSLIDEIETKAFDEAEVNGTVSSTSDLTSSLGAESGENVSTPDTSSAQAFSSLTVFDDIDDYNNYTRKVDTEIAENYTITCVVEYVNPDNPNNTSGSKTYCKRITVTATSPFFSALPSVQLQKAITY